MEKKLTIEDKRKLLYNFITWYNARPKVDKHKDGFITVKDVEKYLK